MEPTLEQWKERALVAEALLEERTQECEKLRVELESKGDLSDKMRDALGENGIPGIYQIKDAGEFDPTQLAVYEQLLHMMSQKQARDDISLEELRRAMMDQQYWEVYGKQKMPSPKADKPIKKTDSWKAFDIEKKYAPRMTISNVQAEWKMPAMDKARFGFSYGDQNFDMEVDRHEIEEYSRKDLAQTSRLLAGAIAEKVGMPTRDKDELALRLMDCITVLLNPTGRYRK